MDFDGLLSRVGGMGRYQLGQYAVLCASVLPIGLQTLANSFIADTVDSSCISAYTHHKNRCNDLHPLIRDRPMCADNQTLPDYSTTVSDFDLVCDRASLKHWSQSIFMLGFLVGAFGLGIVADKYGRKLTWYIAILSSVLTGVAAAMVKQYYLHVIFRALTAVACAGAYTVGFVLSLEIIGKRHRLIYGLMFHAFFAVGYILLALLAYFIRDWRHLQIAISVYSIIFLPAYFFINESPRWYLTQGRHDDVKVELKRIATCNRKVYDEIVIDKELESLEKQKLRDSTKQKKSVIDLFRTPNLRLTTINIFFNWFVNSLVYYGLSHGISKLSGNTYINMLIAGVLEMVALIVLCFFLKRVGRRLPISALLCSGGVTCLICAVIPIEYGIVRTVLSTIGRFLIAGSFSIIYVFSAEVFPTVVRNSGVGAGSMHARIGGFIAPLIADLGSNFFRAFPMLIFGCLSVIAGVLTLALPETLNQHLPETIEDAENFGKKETALTCESHTLT